MTSFANKMQIFLWQIATVTPIKSTRTSVNMPGFQTKSLTILPQTIVMVNDFVWKPGILTLVLVPLIHMTVAICHKNICILLANDVMLLSI